MTALDRIERAHERIRDMEAAAVRRAKANGAYRYEENEVNEESRSWPEPLGAAALHGLAGDVVRAILPHTEADPAAILLQFLATFGIACGRTSYVLVEADRHPPQIWPVMVGETAKGRKGTSWGRIRHLMELAAPLFMETRCESGLSSGEGLIWAVRDPITKLLKNKESGEREEQEIDTGVEDKRLMVIEAEFASPLRHIERSGNTLSSTIRQFWDTGNVSSLTKNSPARTTGSMIGIIGHVTVDELQRYMTRTELGNGFANRFLFVCTRRSKRLPFGGGEIDLRPLADRIDQCLGKVETAGERRIHWTDAARAVWIKAYDVLSEGRPGMVGAVTSRAEAQTLRLALVYALLDGSAFLEAEHLHAALEVWRYCDQSAAYLFGASLGDPVADEIRHALGDAPDGLTRWDINNLFNRNRGASEIGSALDLLIERGLARLEMRPTAGRPETRWFAQ